MEFLGIEGGVPLSGTVGIEGAKNAALPACVAALLTDEQVVLHRVPQLRDVSTILYTLGALGKRVVRHGDHVAIAAGSGLSAEADPYSIRQMRASFLVLAPLIARLGEAVVPLPGGCKLGTRPIDLHLRALHALGARIDERADVIRARAERLRGARIDLPLPSVGATEQVLMAASLAAGETILTNASIEPEVEDLCALLKAMGAEIEVDGRTIRIAGRDRLHGAEHTLIPDRLEAGTFLLAGAIAGGSVTVEGACTDHLASMLRTLESTGAEITAEPESVTIRSPECPMPTQVITAPYPGFPTDLHPQFVAYLSTVPGLSRIEERIFESRFAYVDALCAMGARISRSETTLTIEGVERLRGATVAATDIRAGAALVLAGLAAEGYTCVTELEHIDRGYACLEGKLKDLGARIERSDG